MIPKKHQASLQRFQERISITFNNTDLLLHALAHSSARVKNPLNQIINNERLEFLGDAVLKLIVSDFLFCHFVDESEGFLTQLRAQLVADKFLCQLARQIKLGDFLILSKGEENSGGRQRPSNLANGFEALLGAVFIDQGYQVATTFFHSLFSKESIQLEKMNQVDYKSRLQEWCQKQGFELPVYELIEEEGPDHHKKFFVEVTILTATEKKVWKGYGFSKKEAEQHAAHQAMQDIPK